VELGSEQRLLAVTVAMNAGFTATLLTGTLLYLLALLPVVICKAR